MCNLKSFTHLFSVRVVNDGLTNLFPKKFKNFLVNTGYQDFRKFVTIELHDR